MTREYLIKGRNSTEVVTYEELLRQLAMHVLGVQSSDSLSRDISDIVEFEIELAKVSLSLCPHTHTHTHTDARTLARA